MAKPSSPEPADRDRLFVRRIIDERALHLFGDNLQSVVDMPVEERWRIVHPSPDDDEDDREEMPPDVREIVIGILSDLEAWIVVERVRRASRLTPRKRRGGKHVD